jgi:hypothetical protein
VVFFFYRVLDAMVFSSQERAVEDCRAELFFRMVAEGGAGRLKARFSLGFSFFRVLDAMVF